jgi:hypothetical protein
MRHEEEMGSYLRSLLEHSEVCASADCADCRVMQTIYDLLQQQIFATVVFAEVPLENKRRAAAHLG